MSAPQLTDPGTSNEWFPAVEDRSRADAAARRQRFQRMVTYTMVGLTAFSVLGLACFAWRRHSLKADLEAPPPAAVALPAAAAPAALLAAAPASPTPPPVSVAPAPAVEPAATPVTPKPVANAKPTSKKPTRGSVFFKGVKPQPATLKR